MTELGAEEKSSTEQISDKEIRPSLYQRSLNRLLPEGRLVKSVEFTLWSDFVLFLSTSELVPPVTVMCYH